MAINPWVCQVNQPRSRAMRIREDVALLQLGHTANVREPLAHLHTGQHTPTRSHARTHTLQPTTPAGRLCKWASTTPANASTVASVRLVQEMDKVPLVDIL